MEENKEGTVVPVRPLSGPVTIKLMYPVKLGASDEAEVVSELTFRRPKGKDMKDVPTKPNVGDVMKLASRLAGQPPVVFDQLEMADFNRVIEVVSDFLQPGQ